MCDILGISGSCVVSAPLCDMMLVVSTVKTCVYYSYKYFKISSRQLCTEIYSFERSVAAFVDIVMYIDCCETLV